MIKSEQITDKPSVKSKRKIRPFDIVITNDETQRVIKVSMVREIRESSQSSPNHDDYNDPVPRPSGLHAHENPQESNLDNNHAEYENNQYNSLESARCLAETFCRGLISLENFVACQQNDTAIQEYSGYQKWFKGSFKSSAKHHEQISAE